MALALNNLKTVDMPLKQRNQSIKKIWRTMHMLYLEIIHINNVKNKTEIKYE